MYLLGCRTKQLQQQYRHTSTQKAETLGSAKAHFPILKIIVLLIQKIRRVKQLPCCGLRKLSYPNCQSFCPSSVYHEKAPMKQRRFPKCQVSCQMQITHHHWNLWRRWWGGKKRTKIEILKWPFASPHSNNHDTSQLSPFNSEIRWMLDSGKHIWLWICTINHFLGLYLENQF